MENREAPFILACQGGPCYLSRSRRRRSSILFTKRIVRTAKFEIGSEELDFYDALGSVFVGSVHSSGRLQFPCRARAVGFTMAMLQRRFASSSLRRPSHPRTYEGASQKNYWLTR